MVALSVVPFLWFVGTVDTISTTPPPPCHADRFIHRNARMGLRVRSSLRPHLTLPMSSSLLLLQLFFFYYSLWMAPHSPQPFSRYSFLLKYARRGKKKALFFQAAIIDVLRVSWSPDKLFIRDGVKVPVRRGLLVAPPIDGKYSFVQLEVIW